MNQNYDTIILSPHIDDEFIGAGELICEKSKNNKKILIIYFSSSTYKFNSRNKKFEKIDQNQRESEIKSIIKQMKTRNISTLFLRVNNYRLFNEIYFLKTYKKLLKIMSEMKYNYLFCPTYEGGHLEHDLVNFMLSLLVKKSIIPQKKCIEFPLYTSRIKIFDFKKYNRLIFKKCFAPEFINNDQKEIKIINKTQIKNKIKYLSLFKSQNPKHLVDNFGFKDRFKPFKLQNHKQKPYSALSLNNIIGIFDQKYKIYDGKISFNKFKKFIIMIESKILKK